MCYFQKSYYISIQKTFNNGTCIELWVTFSPFAKKTCGALQPSWDTSETLGSRYSPMYSPLSPSSRLFHCCLLLITPLCAPRFGFSVSHTTSLHLCRDWRKVAVGLQALGSHPILSWWEQRQSISPALTGLWGAAGQTWQTGTASPTAPSASITAGRQNASEVCTAAPSLNNIHLCRQLPCSHPSTTLLPQDPSRSLAAGHNCSPNSSRRVLPFLSEGLNKVSGKTTDDSRSFG